MKKHVYAFVLLLVLFIITPLYTGTKQSNFPNQSQDENKRKLDAENDLIHENYLIPESIIDKENEPLSSDKIRNQFHLSEIPKAGILDPLSVTQIGADPIPFENTSVRTDLVNNPKAELDLDAGSSDNGYSADCTGGYFQVGPSGSADFGSSAGTISLWVKWNDVAPHGRFWGQDHNFETRWSSNQLVCDFDSDFTLTGSKTDWIIDHWYFIAITWDETTNNITMYWGDENNEPIKDATISTWTGSVLGLHMENDIMSSRGGSYQVNGHVDEFRYFNVSRSSNEIRADYRNKLTYYETGLVHYYQFENSLTDIISSVNLIPVGSYSFSADVISTPYGWKGEQVEVNISNLTKLYALNGTFDDGIPGVNVDWSGSASYYPWGWDAGRIDGDSFGRQTQRASFVDSPPGYLLVENQARLRDNPIRYRHYDGTLIYWDQQITNIPYTEDFLFSIDYLYQRGPLGTNYDGVFEFKVELRDGPAVLWAWEIDPATLSQRGVWYNQGPMAVSLSGAPSTFEIRVVLEVDVFSYVDIAEGNPDLDGDPSNGLFATLLFDNVSLIGANPPSLESVDMKVSLPNIGETAILGQFGAGTVRINNSYWESCQMTLTLSSNTSVSYDYNCRFSRMLRFRETSWTKHPLEYGVGYEVFLNKSPSLTMYINIEEHSEYSDFRIQMSYPVDWENVTIEDTVSNDVTSQCTVDNGELEISGSILDTIGWWKINFDSNNYVKDIVPQVYKEGVYEWENNSIFYSGNQTRVYISIGTPQFTPSLINNVNVTWFQPNYTIWSEDSVSGGFEGQINSSARILGPLNATPGCWSVEIHWTNGSEIAYGSAPFELHHHTTLTPTSIQINTNTGKVVIGSVQYLDTDRNQYILETNLLDANPIIIGYWSGGETIFSVNIANSRWDADFNTSLVNPGLHTVTVNASTPFFENSSCSFIINVTTMTRLSSPNAPWTSAYWNDTTILSFNFEEYDYNTELWSPVQNDSDYVSFWVNWTEGEWLAQETIIPGIYQILINTGVQNAATWILNVTCSRFAYESQQIILTLEVNPVPTSLTILGNESAGIYFDQSYILNFSYKDQNTQPILDATFEVSINPSIGLEYSSVDPIIGEDGNYTLTISPSSIGIYSIDIVGMKDNYTNGTASFALDVELIASNLLIFGNESVQIQNQDSYVLKMQFEHYNGTVIDNAQLYLVSVNPATGIDISNIIGVFGEPGNYSVTLTPTTADVYVIEIVATKINTHNATIEFVLEAVGIPTELLCLGEEIVEVGLGGDYNASFRYQDSGEIGIEDASIEVLYWEGPSGGLNWSATAPAVGQPGNYSIKFHVNISGTYMVTVGAEKENHQSASTFFFIIVEYKEANFVLHGDISAIINLGSNYTLLVQYTNGTGFGLEDAEIEVAQMIPSIGLIVSNPEYIGDGNYSIVLTPLSAGTYTLVLNASKVNYQTKFVTFTLTASRIASFLSVSPSSASVALDQNYTVILRFFNETFGGLENASVSVFFFSPEVGVNYTEAQDLGDGNYSIEIIPEIKGTYEFVFRATLANHQNGTATFTLAVTSVPTELRVSDGTTSASVDFEETFDLVLYYVRTDLNENISLANLEVRSTPSYDLVDNIIEMDGYYVIQLSSDILGTWSLTITASKFAHINSTVQYLFEVTAITTTLIGSGPPDSMYIGHSYNFILRYNISENVGINNAAISFTGLASDEISWITPINGWYNFTLMPKNLGDYGDISLRFSLEGYEEKTFVFSIEVSKVETTLTGDATPTSIYYGHSSTFTLYYDAGDDGGVSNASIAFSGVASEEISWIEIADGEYDITLSPESLGNYTDVSLRFYKIGYEDQEIVFSFMVKNIETILVGDDSTHKILFSRSFCLTLWYNSTSQNGVENASILYSGLKPTEIYWNNTEKGRYDFCITPEDIGHYRVTLTFEKIGFQSQTFTFSIDVLEIPIIVGLNYNLPSNYTMVEAEIFTVAIELLENDTSQAIEGLTTHCMIIEEDRIIQIELMQETSSGVYTTNMTTPNANDAGYILKITASKQNYVEFNLSIPLFSTLIELGSGPNSTLTHLYNGTEGSELTLILDLIDTSTNHSVDSAIVQFGIYNSTHTVQSGVFTESLNGLYSSSFIIPQADDESYHLVIRAEKEHCLTFTYYATLYSHLMRFRTQPSNLPIPVVLVENNETRIEFRLVDIDSGSFVEGVNVTYSILLEDECIRLKNGNLVDSFIEVSGVYSAKITVPIHNSTCDYCLKIRAEKEHYETLVIDHVFHSQIDQEKQNEMLMQVAFQYGSYAGLFILATGLVLAGRRSYLKKKRLQILQMQEAKTRFDDVRNIIAILVLHRTAGVPVYSKMFKGGFEEAMISGFISAITNFRLEIGEKEKLWTAIPISDIVTAVQTNSLICALITGDVPSPDQIEKIEAFAFAIGALYDDHFERIHAFSTFDLDEIETIVEPTFFDIVTGDLLKKYTWDSETKLSRQYQSINKTLARFRQDDGFTPDELVKTMVLDGVDEGSACLLVIQAMEEGVIFERPIIRKLTERDEAIEEREIPYSLIPITSDSKYMISEIEAAEEFLKQIEDTYIEKEEDENGSSESFSDDDIEPETD